VNDLFRFLHVLSMAAWLAAALWLAGDARRSLTAGGAEALAFTRRARAAVGLDGAAGGLTILTGLALLHFSGIWPNVRTGLWLGMALAVVRAAITGAVLRPGVRRITAGLEAGQAPSALLPEAKKLAAVSGVGHLAWLVALAGMVVRF
jgi:hypothetical protein